MPTLGPIRPLALFSKLLGESLLHFKVRFADSRPLPGQYFIEVRLCNRWWKNLFNYSRETGNKTIRHKSPWGICLKTYCWLRIFVRTLEARPFAARSCIVVWTAPGCFGPHGIHIPSGVLMKNMASWVLRTGSKSTSLTCLVKSRL